MSNGFSKGLERLRIAQVIGGLWEGRLSAFAAGGLMSKDRPEGFGHLPFSLRARCRNGGVVVPYLISLDPMNQARFLSSLESRMKRYPARSQEHIDDPIVAAKLFDIA